MSKKTIICLVGKSGSGKSTVADILSLIYDIPQVQSYTTREKRDESDTGHKFVCEEEMSEYFDAPDCLAKTTWDGVRYCCLARDLKQVNTYVIDETGLDYLKKHFAKDYNILSVWIERDKHLRIKDVGIGRVNRDNGKFYKEIKDYEYIINSNGDKASLVPQCQVLVDRVSSGFKK